MDHSNPVNALAQLSEMDLSNKAYLARTLVSGLNAMLIGQVAMHVRNTMPSEGGGVDAANDLLAAAIEREIGDKLSDEAGLEVAKPEEVAGILGNIILDIIEILDVPAAIAEVINTPLATLQFLKERNADQKVDPKTAERLAAALEVSLDDATRALAMNLKRQAENFSKVAPHIPEALEHITFMGTFDDLPNRFKMRIAQKFEDALGKKLANEISRVVQGSAENMADIAFIKATITSIKTWIKNHADVDDLARQLRAAA